jgi:hypothetical protein
LGQDSSEHGVEALHNARAWNGIGDDFCRQARAQLGSDRIRSIDDDPPAPIASPANCVGD